MLQQINPDILNTIIRGTEPWLVYPDFILILYHSGEAMFLVSLESVMKMKIIQRNLSAADRIASTSHIMKKQTETIYKPEKDITVTPFGVDSEKFRPMEVCRDKAKIRVGTVKKMASQYGIATLIEAFAIVKNEYQGDIELVLVGGGPEEDDFKLLAQKLDVGNYVDFVGPVPHHTVPEYLNSFDIYVALSNTRVWGSHY